MRQTLEQGYISRLFGRDFQIDNFRFTAEDSAAQSADAALAQCRERDYAARFVGEDRPVYYVGVNYDPKSRTIGDVRAECVEARSRSRASC